jgi:hypothetical protein
MTDQEILERAERAAKSVIVPDGRFEDLLRRRDHKRRNRRITAGVVGFAVFVAAVWIVRDVASLNSSRTPANQPTQMPATQPTETGPAQTASPPALVSSPPDKVTQGTCSDGARSLLGLSYGQSPSPPFHNQIWVLFEVRRSPVGHEWRITLRTSPGNIPMPPRRLVFQGIRVASDSGDFAVEDRVPEAGKGNRRDLFWAQAIDTQTGQVCRAHATIH